MRVLDTPVRGDRPIAIPPHTGHDGRVRDLAGLLRWASHRQTAHLTPSVWPRLDLDGEAIALDRPPPPGIRAASWYSFGRRWWVAPLERRVPRALAHAAAEKVVISRPRDVVPLPAGQILAPTPGRPIPIPQDKPTPRPPEKKVKRWWKKREEAPVPAARYIRRSGRFWKGATCPSCGRRSVFGKPGRPWAVCNHRGSCGWEGTVYELAEQLLPLSLLSD